MKKSSTSKNEDIGFSETVVQNNLVLKRILLLLGALLILHAMGLEMGLSFKKEIEGLDKKSGKVQDGLINLSSSISQVSNLYNALFKNTPAYSLNSTNIEAPIASAITKPDYAPYIPYATLGTFCPKSFQEDPPIIENKPYDFNDVRDANRENLIEKNFNIENEPVLRVNIKHKAPSGKMYLAFYQSEIGDSASLFLGKKDMSEQIDMSDKIVTNTIEPINNSKIIVYLFPNASATDPIYFTKRNSNKQLRNSINQSSGMINLSLALDEIIDDQVYLYSFKESKVLTFKISD